jgi:carbon monoxide dehydrogenase subunit G
VISIKEEIAVPSPRPRVWEVVSEPAEVVSCIAGAELGDQHEDGTFDGALVIKFGAIRVKFAARISLELDEAQFEGRLTARGGDGQGATRFQGEAVFRVVEGPEPDTTLVLMDGEVTLRGKLASLVESGATVVTSRMTKDFTAKLIAKCTEPEVAAEQVPATAGATAQAPAAAAPATSAPATAPAPARTGPLSRFGAWFARVVLRRKQPPPPPDRAAPATPSPSTTQTQEIGSDHAPAQ